MDDSHRTGLDVLGSHPADEPSTHLDVTVAAASCPLGLAINTIGGRWKLHILRRLLLAGGSRYNELLAGIDGVSAKELTRNLRELESSRLVIKREGDAQGYVLTPLGMEIEAPFRALGMFGAAMVRR